ncbi:TIGR02266 family protein [Myxococcota bacterium]|nr:TIGR02266 family protein [Myxococcota bacterium]MBU1432748.1 TIGR02266 family protein [Myxococcota bacterium]MBU1896909.1 TIGR02266 family protein [Myxococcota bacterium]
MTHQRQHQRVPAQLEVEVSQSSDHNFYTGFTHNISEGGLFLATNMMIPIGSELTFRFNMEGFPEAIMVRGVVRWLREPHSFIGDLPPGLGVQFLDLPAPHKRFVQSFINRNRESIFFDDDD